jgi:hypothetical protein
MRLHPNAARVAEHLCGLSKDGCPGSEQYLVPEMQSFLGLIESDLLDALGELEANELISIPVELGTIVPRYVEPQWTLFFLMDDVVKGWDLDADARKVAKAVSVAPTNSVKSADLAQTLGWDHRRLNPPTHYLYEHGVLDVRSPRTKREFYYPVVSKTDLTDEWSRVYPPGD